MWETKKTAQRQTYSFHQRELLPANQTKHLPSHRLTWKCTDFHRKTNYFPLGPRGFVHKHIFHGPFRRSESDPPRTATQAPRATQATRETRSRTCLWEGHRKNQRLVMHQALLPRQWREPRAELGSRLRSRSLGSQIDSLRVCAVFL